MTNSAIYAVVCFAFLAGLTAAAPQNSSVSLHKTGSASSECADRPCSNDTEDNGDSRAPDQAKGTTLDSLSIKPEKPTPALHGIRMDAVLSMINYPWQDLGFKVVFKGSRAGYRAMTLTARKQIEVYARPGEDAFMQAFDLAHEFGHAFDLKNNDRERRQKWLQLRGIDPSTPWFGCDACPDYATPAGDFAETFAYLLLGPGSYHSLMAPPPKPDQIPALAKFCGIERISEALMSPSNPLKLVKTDAVIKAPSVQKVSTAPSR
jgi:hypothetical protein